MVTVSVTSASSQSSCHRADSTRTRCWSRWFSSSGNLLLPTVPSAGCQDGPEVGGEAEQKPEDVGGVVVGGEHQGQHQAPGQQGDGAGGSAGDVAGGIDLVLGQFDRVKH